MYTSLRLISFFFSNRQWDSLVRRRPGTISEEFRIMEWKWKSLPTTFAREISNGLLLLIFQPIEIRFSNSVKKHSSPTSESVLRFTSTVWVNHWCSSMVTRLTVYGFRRNKLMKLATRVSQAHSAMCTRLVG